MVVDLGRLREAINDDTVWDTAKAVLDAPTVWWCAISEYAWVGNEISSARDHCVSEHPSGCGMVVLVPVKGGQE